MPGYGLRGAAGGVTFPLWPKPEGLPRQRLSEAAKAAALVIVVQFIISLSIALAMPVTKQFDEIAHFSAIAHQHDQPEIFPHYGDRRRWRGLQPASISSRP